MVVIIITCALVVGTDLLRHSLMIFSDSTGHTNSPVLNVNRIPNAEICLISIPFFIERSNVQ